MEKIANFLANYGIIKRGQRQVVQIHPVLVKIHDAQNESKSRAVSKIQKFVRQHEKCKKIIQTFEIHKRNPKNKKFA